MKAFLRWLGRTIGSAVSIVLVIVLFPHISKLAQRLMPDESGAAIKASVVLSTKLDNSARLETLKVEEDGILHYDIQAAFLGSVAEINISYKYDASFGIDLSKVEVRPASHTVIFYLPEPEVLQDSLTPNEVYRNDFWYPGFTDNDMQKLLEEERLARRGEYLSGEHREEMWNATVSAFEQTISAWMKDIDAEVQFSYQRMEKTDEQQ